MKSRLVSLKKRNTDKRESERESKRKKIDGAINRLLQFDGIFFKIFSFDHLASLFNDQYL